jgi:branched-chain amino acid transport system permease protein
MVIIVSILPNGIVPALAAWWSDRSRVAAKPAEAVDAAARQIAR